MAESLTFANARRRFQLSEPEPASAAPGLSPFDRMAIAREEGRTPVLDPDELVEMMVERETRDLADEALRAFLPELEPEYEPGSDSAVLSRVAPQERPGMVKPPTLHAPDELAAGIGSAEGRPDRFSSGQRTFEPPTYSRTPEPRGEPDFAPQGQQEVPKWKEYARFALEALGSVAQGAAAGESGKSFLGGYGAAMEADRRRRLQEETQTARVDAQTAMIPKQFDLERQNREILNNLHQSSARHLDALARQIDASLEGVPRSENRDAALWQMAEKLARAGEITRLRRQGLNPMEAEKAILAAEKMQAEIEATNELARQRRASAVYDETRTREVGRDEPEDLNARMRNAATLLNAITRIENDLIDRHTKTDMRPGSPSLNQEILDGEAMKRDPQYARWQRLQDHFDVLVSGAGRAPEAVSGNVPQGSPPRSWFDPDAIRKGVLNRMGAGGVR
jgi:hypothetical protein